MQCHGSENCPVLDKSVVPVGNPIIFPHAQPCCLDSSNPGMGSVERLVLPVHVQGEYLCLGTTERDSLTALFNELGRKDVTRSS